MRIVTDGDMSADVVSPAIDMRDFRHLSMILRTNGAGLTGAWVFKVSNDQEAPDVDDMDTYTLTIPPSDLDDETLDAHRFVEIRDFDYNWLAVMFDRSAGTGAMQVDIERKGMR